MAGTDPPMSDKIFQIKYQIRLKHKNTADTPITHFFESIGMPAVLLFYLEFIIFTL